MRPSCLAQVPKLRHNNPSCLVFFLGPSYILEWILNISSKPHVFSFINLFIYILRMIFIFILYICVSSCKHVCAPLTYIHLYFFFQKLQDWVPYCHNNLWISGNVEIETELFQRGTTLVQMVPGVEMRVWEKGGSINKNKLSLKMSYAT